MNDLLTINDIPDEILYYEIFSKLSYNDKQSFKSIILTDKRFHFLSIYYLGNMIRNDHELIVWNGLWDVRQWSDNQKINNYLSFDKLNEVSKGILYSYQINSTRLWLDNIQMNRIDPSIGNLIDLTYLNLSNNQITCIDPSIGLLINLTELNLHNNQIKCIDQSIYNLTKLTRLALHGNQINRIDPLIGNLINLTELYFNNNQLTCINPSIGKLTKLERLGLKHNQITCIDPLIGRSMRNLINLKRLDLQYNQITCINPCVTNLDSLITLYLSYNELLMNDQVYKILKLQQKICIVGDPDGYESNLDEPIQYIPRYHIYCITILFLISLYLFYNEIIQIQSIVHNDYLIYYYSFI
jgi:Leucine-rich repeat (LRR) protein